MQIVLRWKAMSRAERLNFASLMSEVGLAVVELWLFLRSGEGGVFLRCDPRGSRCLRCKGLLRLTINSRGLVADERVAAHGSRPEIAARDSQDIHAG